MRHLGPALLLTLPLFAAAVAGVLLSRRAIAWRRPGRPVPGAPELIARPPLPVQPRDRTLRFGTGWFTISLLALVGALWLTVRDVRETRLLASEGVAATAIVIDRRVDRTEEIDDYWLLYTYEAPGADGRLQPFQRWERVPYGVYRDHPPETTLAIHYAAGDPAVAARRDRSSYFALEPGVLATGMSFLFLLVGVAILEHDLRRRWWRRLLDRDGVETTAAIVQRWADKEGRRVAYCVAFRFDAEGHGPQLAAEVNRGAYERLRVGDTVALRYARRQPWRHRLSL